jgi:hypothetical protein
VASRIQEYPPASVAGLMVRFGRAEFKGQLFHRIEVVSAEIQVELLVMFEIMSAAARTRRGRP